MKLHITHDTTFVYSEPLRSAVQCLHLRPMQAATQAVLRWTLQTPGVLMAHVDGLGNAQDTFSVPVGLTTVAVRAHGWVESRALASFVDSSRVPPSYYALGSALAHPHPRMNTWALEQLGEVQLHEETVLALAQAVKARVRYRSGRTQVDTEALEAFDWGWGVCQDQAHVMVAVCRSLGWSARYVSGYFYDEAAPELASHAWVDVCLDAPAQRWLSVDVTHGCLTDERHVRLAVGRDYAQCSPTRGVRQGGGEEHMQVRVQIEVAD